MNSTIIVLAKMVVELFVLDVHLPRRNPCCAGVILIDRPINRAFILMRKDWSGIAAPEEAEVIEGYEAMLRGELENGDASALLDTLGNSLSHVLRISDSVPLEVEDMQIAIRDQATLRGLL